MRIRQLKNNFTAGQIDPRLIARLELKQYKNGAAIIKDCTVLPFGGIKRRGGFGHIDETYNDQWARYVSFQAGTARKYLLVFTAGESTGSGQFKVYYKSSTNPVVFTLSATVTASPVSTLTEQQLHDMQVVQSYDTLLLFHPDVQTIVITRSSDSSWACATKTYTNIPVYPFSGITTTTYAGTLTPTATTGTITLTASSAVLTSAMVGQFININDGLVFVTAFTDSTHVIGQVRVDLSSITAAATTKWNVESGYEAVMSSSRGWPGCGLFYEGRLFLGGLKSRPQTLLGSKIGNDYYNFDEGLGRDDDAINITADDDQVNAILNLFRGQHLQIFTTGGEYYVPQDPNVALTPSNIALVKSTQHGSSTVRPVAVDGATIFIDASGKVLRSFIFNQIDLNYEAPNISLEGSSLIDQPVSMAVRKTTSSDDSILAFIVNDSGNMAVLNYMRDQEIKAFSEFSTNGTIEQVAVVGDDVFVLVKRTINSVTRRFVEHINDSHRLDCSILQTTTPATTSWSGFSHLNFQDCKAIGDDYVLDNVTPLAGTVTTNEAVSELEVGLEFLASTTLLPTDTETQSGTTTRARRRLIRAIVEVYQSRDILVGGYDTTTLTFDADEFDEDASNLLKTGEFQVRLGGYSTADALVITQTAPLEFTILAVTLEVNY